MTSPAPSAFSFSNVIVSGGSFVQQIQASDGDAGFQTLKNYVAPGAFHNSGERFDPPRCHPNTRVAVLKKIMDWIVGQDPDTRDAWIMWLYGPAGAGKSAIAQSIAEQCFAEGRLLSSFFFGRSDPSRNNYKALFSTLAYQIGLAFPQARDKLSSTLQYDPLMPTKSVREQFHSLVIVPVQEILRSLMPTDYLTTKVIIIDGLDECQNPKQQCEILDVIFNGFREYQIPLVFLVASRPEPEISARFSAPDASDSLTRLFLDYTYKPQEDIQLFLREKFGTIAQNHPFKIFLPSGWPQTSVVEEIATKSSGQFIYAATVVKYVESTRHKPHQRLDIIREIRPSRDHPFAELDALYTQIFSGVEDVDQVLAILGFRLMNPSTFFGSEDLEDILQSEPGDIPVLLSSLSSVVDLKSVRFHHASLPDFLLDKSRSGPFHIDITIDRTDNLRKCIQYLSNHAEPGACRAQTGGGAFLLAMDFFDSNYKHASYTLELKEDIMSLDLFRTSKSTPHLQEHRYMTQFVPHFFAFLKDATWADAEAMYERHIDGFGKLFEEILQVCFTDLRLTCVLALIPFYLQRKEQLGALHVLPLPFAPDPMLWVRDEQYLHLIRWCEFGRVEYLQLLHNFMTNPDFPEKYRLNGQRYAIAACCCLAYICDEDSLPSTITLPPQLRYHKGSFLTDPPETMAKHNSAALWGVANFLGQAAELFDLTELCTNAEFSEAEVVHPEECIAAKDAIAKYLQRIIT